MGATTDLQRCLTAPGVTPEGDGWRCIHSSCSPDGARWWMWQRIVRYATDEEIARSFDANR